MVAANAAKAPTYDASTVTVIVIAVAPPLETSGGTNAPTEN